MSRARGAPVGEMGLRSCQDDLDRIDCPSVVNAAGCNLYQGLAKLGGWHCQWGQAWGILVDFLPLEG